MTSSNDATEHYHSTAGTYPEKFLEVEWYNDQNAFKGGGRGVLKINFC